MRTIDTLPHCAGWPCHRLRREWSRQKMTKDVGRDRALYRLTIKAPPHNLPPRYNVCPTDPVDVVTERDGSRDFVRMRWGLVPSWWPKPLKELRAATFNARVETVAEKPFFRDAFRRTRCLLPA